MCAFWPRGGLQIKINNNNTDNTETLEYSLDSLLSYHIVQYYVTRLEIQIKQICKKLSVCQTCIYLSFVLGNFA